MLFGLWNRLRKEGLKRKFLTVCLPRSMNILAKVDFQENCQKSVFAISRTVKTWEVGRFYEFRSIDNLFFFSIFE